MLAGKTILWICFVWPEPDSSAAGYRTKKLLEQLKAEGHRVVASSGCQKNSYQDDLNLLGIETVNFIANDSSFDIFVRELNPDIVFFDRFMIEEQFSWRVKKECPDAIRILDTIDLHFLRSARQSSVEPQQFCSQALPACISENPKLLRELAAIFRSDLSILVSDFEYQLLIREFSVPESLLTVLPWGYSDKKDCPAFEDRKDLVLIGNFNHAPNRDSLEFLITNLWPEVRQTFIQNNTEIPELHIYGAYIPDQIINKFKSSIGVKIIGKANNVFETLAAYRLNLAALRFGAGLKGKILDGWYVGTPCIASTIAAEGIADKTSFGGFVAESKQEFSTAVYEYYTNKSLWQEASNKASLILQHNFSHTKLNSDFIKIIDNLIAVDRLKSNNIFGQILWHQQFKSTEYMSRWIESKNSK